jgi:hypothetical protein
MAKLSIFGILLVALLCVMAPRGRAETAVGVVPEKIEKLPGRYLFPAYAQTEVTFPSATDVWIGWKAEFDSAKHHMRNFGIEARDQHGGGSVSTHLGSIKATSRDGNIRVIMKNMEDFPMEIKIYQEKK